MGPRRILETLTKHNDEDIDHDRRLLNQEPAKPEIYRNSDITNNK
jgi:hypothetical protein